MDKQTNKQYTLFDVFVDSLTKRRNTKIKTCTLTSIDCSTLFDANADIPSEMDGTAAAFAFLLLLGNRSTINEELVAPPTAAAMMMNERRSLCVVEVVVDVGVVVVDIWLLLLLLLMSSATIFERREIDLKDDGRKENDVVLLVVDRSNNVVVIVIVVAISFINLTNRSIVRFYFSFYVYVFEMKMFYLYLNLNADRVVSCEELVVSCNKMKRKQISALCFVLLNESIPTPTSRTVYVRTTTS